ncbi:MAG: DUF1211 domain-containing protein [Candidatus Cloacimonetes bacterium]|nr:DUF1211 domain-containing protein [Candidatus Cloacimonadota bacterium]
MAEKDLNVSLLSKTRVEALTDGVYAIAMTLMVLNIEVPEHHVVESANDLLRSLRSIGPQLFNYVLSFAILMMLWIRNNREQHRLKNISKIYTHYTLVSLMFVCLLPFTTSLMGSYSGMVVAEVVFHLNLLALGTLTWLRYCHLRKYTHLLHTGAETSINKATSVRLVLSLLVVPLVGLAITPFSPSFSSLCYLLIPLIALSRKAHIASSGQEASG